MSATPDLFAPAAPAAPLPAMPVAETPRVDGMKLMRGMAALPRLSPARNDKGQDCCLPCGEPIDTAKPFLAVGGFEFRETEDGGRERRRAAVFMHVPCHATWWTAHCAAALAAGNVGGGAP